MRRPLLLGCVVLVLVAGCLGPAATDNSTPTAATPEPTTSTPAPTTAAPTTHVGMGADGWYHGYTFSAYEVGPAGFASEVAPAATTLEPEREPLVRRGAANGSVTATHAGEHGPLSGTDYVRVNGTYYAVTETTLDSEPRVAFRFDLEGPVGARNGEHDLDRARENAVAAENLSAPDRRAFFEGLPPAEERPEPDEGSFSAGFFVYYESDTAPANSTLTDGDTHFVEHEGAYYAIAVDERQRTTRYTTHYGFERVADTPEAFAEAVRSEFVTPLSSLPDRERLLLLDVVENGSVHWDGDEADTPAHIEARARLVRSLSPDRHGLYVSVDGTTYRIRLVETVE